MSDTTFVTKQTVITATWLNEVNDAVYHAIGTGVGGLAPTSPADVRTNLGLAATASPSGASLIGFDNSISGYTNDHVQSVIDEIHGILLLLTNINHQANNWDDAASPNTAEQVLEYTNPTTSTVGGHDWTGWAALVHNQGTNSNNITPLIGHGYHDATFDNLTGAVWGVVTEAWSNRTNYTTLVGGEFATIAMDPDTAAPSVGMNSVFKNRLDGVTTIPAGAGLYNRYSAGMLITSQNRPATGDPSAGSGWNSAITVGDVGFGAGLDWEGGSHYPGSKVYKAYSTVLDLTNALTDLAGGYPWHTLYKNSLTYWGMRFNGVLSGSLDTNNVVVNAGGGGYNVGDVGTITSGGGSGAYYVVASVVAGAVTTVKIAPTGRGSGYVTTVGATTAIATGTGNGALTLDIAPANGYTWGADTGVGALGAGYAIGDVSSINGATAGSMPIWVRVLTINGGGGVLTFEMITPEEVPAAGRPSNGSGYTVGNHATTNITGAGAGFQVAILKVYVDVTIGGEKWEYWRMTNPSNPSSSGSRDAYIDASFPPTSREVGLAVNDSYGTACIQAITSSAVPTMAVVGTASTALVALSTGAMTSAGAAWGGAYTGGINIVVDGNPHVIPFI